MRALLIWVAGFLFGCGLVLAGMTEPYIVQAFLDPFGNWDLRLAIVMGGAVTVYGCGYWLVARKRQQSWFQQPMQLPTSRQITPSLVIGAGLFGIGWGLAGICPGPGLVSLVSGGSQAWLFVAAMLVGFALAPLAKRLLTPK